MSDREPPDRGADDDEDPGDPVPEIASLLEPAGPHLIQRVRNGIQRRLAAAQWLDFSVNAFLEFLKELGAMCFGLGGGPERPRERNDD